MEAKRELSLKEQIAVLHKKYVELAMSLYEHENAQHGINADVEQRMAGNAEVALAAIKHNHDRIDALTQVTIGDSAETVLEIDVGTFEEADGA